MFSKYLLSPLATLTLILLTESLYRQGYNISLGLPLAALSLCLFWSSIRANVISAILITGYGLGNPIWDTSRLILLLLTVWPVAIGGGLLKYQLVKVAQEAERHRLLAEQNQQKANWVDSLNGNINRVNHYNKRLRDLINGWNVLNEVGKLAIVEEVQGGLANLAQALVGWHAIAEEQERVITKKLGE